MPDPKYTKEELEGLKNVQVYEPTTPSPGMVAGTSSYDKGFIVPEDSNKQQQSLEKFRGENQGWGSELANTIGGGIAKIPFTVIGNTASMLDFEDYTNTDKEIGNSITAWAEEVKGDIEGATKIYRSNDNTLGSREWWMNNGKGLIDSVGGFVLTGGALGKGVQMLSNLTKGSQVIQGLGTITNAAMLNQAESIPMAMNIYRDSYDIALKQGKTDDEALTIASDAAAYAININRINIPLNLTSSAAFLRSPDITRQIAKEYSKKEILSNILLEGTQEYTEENINMIAEKEAKRKAVEGNKYAYDFKNTLNDIFSKEGFETGIIGFAGGAIQTAGTDLLKSTQKDSPSYDKEGNINYNEIGEPVLVNRHQSSKERFNAQQNSLKKIEMLSKTEGLPTVKETLNKVRVTSQLVNDIQEAALNNDDYKVNVLQNELLTNQSLEAFRNGTTEQLLEQYNSIVRDPSSKEKLGDKAGIKAAEAVKQIEDLEKVYIKHQGSPYINDLFKNRSRNYFNVKQVNHLNSAISKAQFEQQQEIAATGFNTVENISTLETTKELQELQARLIETQANTIALHEEYNNILSGKIIPVKEEEIISEEEFIGEDYIPEDDEEQSVIDFMSLVGQAESNKELDSILEQADKAGATDADLIDVIAEHRKFLNKNNTTLNHTPVVETPIMTSDAQQMYPNTKTVDGNIVNPNTLREQISAATGGLLLNSEEVQGLVDAYVKDGRDINDTIEIHAIDYNGKKSIQIKVHDHVLGYFQEDSRHTQEIQDAIRDIKIGDIWTNEEVKKRGLGLTISNGYIKESEDVHTLDELNSIIKTNDSYVIFDQGSTSHRNKGGEPSLITTAILPGDEGSVLPTTYKSLGRYVLSFQNKSGTWKYIPISPSKVENYNTFLNKLRSNSKKVIDPKTGKLILNKEQVDELNDEANKKIFISVDKKQLKGRSLEVSMDINPNTGNIRTSVYSIDNGKLSDRPIAIVEVSPANFTTTKDNDVLLDAINKELGNKIGISIKPESFRNSIPKGEIKGDPATQFQTYTDPKVIYGQDILITVNKEAAALNSTPIEATSTPMSANIEQPIVKPTLTKDEQITAAKAARLSAKQGPLNGGDNAAYKLSNEQADDLINSQELEEVQRIIPKTIPVETRNDLRTFLNHFSQSTTPWGVFKNGVIYLWNEAGSGTGYHEAFHSIFRMAISNKEVDRLLKIAEKEFGKPTAKEILEIKTSTLDYMNLTNQQLSDLVLEEKMADKFMEWKKNKQTPVNIGLKGLFNRIWNMIKELVGMNDNLEVFFNKINRGAFRSSKTIPNKQTFVTDQVYKNLLSGVNQAMSSTKSKQMINTFSARVKQLSRGWKGLTDELPSNNTFLDQLIQERIDSLMTDGYDNAFSQETDVEKDKMIAAIEEELFTLENQEAKELFVEQVNKNLKLFEVNKLGGEEQERDGEDGTTERFGSSEAWTMSIEESTNKVIREYIAFAMYETTDELTGKKVSVAVDNKVIYNGLGHILANIPEEQMMNRFINYAKDNIQAKAVLDMIMSDTGMTYDNDGLITSPSKNFNDIRRIITAFKNVKIAFMHTEFNPIFNSDGVLISNEVKVYNANRNTANKITINNWVNSLIQIKKKENPTSDDWSKRVNTVVRSFKLGGNKVKSNDEITKQVETIQEAFLPLGINLSAGYVRYSLLAYKQTHEAISEDQIAYLSSFEEIVPLDIDIIDQGEYSLKSFLMSNKDPYAGGEEGMSSKLETIATNNSTFDESIATSNFKGSDNNTRHDLIKSSYVLDETLKLRNPDYRNSLVEKYEILKDNVLFKYDKLLNNLKINLIDGVRDHSKTDSEGKVFGDFSEREYLMQHIGYWFGQKNNRFYTLFRQNEASNTAYQAEMPVQNYIDSDGNIIDEAIDNIYLSFNGEYNRISREKAKGLGNIKGYNDKETGRAFRFTEFVNLLPVIGPAKYNELLTNARIGTPISEELEKVIKSGIKKNFNKEIKEFKKILAQNNLIKLSEGKISSNLLLPNNIGQKKLSIEELDKSVSDFYINDYINSFALNQMFDGDYAMSRDDKGVKEVEIDGIKVQVPKQELGIDIVKRNKGAMGSGSDLGPGSHRVSFIKDINVFVTKENGKLIRGEKGDKINSNDAQSLTNINHIMFMATRLGRMSNDVQTILRKIRRGISITNNEQMVLEASQVSLNPWKTVTFGREFYIKTSEAFIDRHEVSYIEDKELYNELMDELEHQENTKQLTSEYLIEFNKELVKLYKPLPGKEHYHNLLNQMDIHGIDQIVAESASKGMTIDPQDSLSTDLDLSKSMIDIPNSYKRLQVETPTGKSVITDGTQLMQLIDSEQVDDTDVIFNGKSMKVGEIRTQYRAAMASTRDNSFKMAESYIKKNADGSTDVAQLKVKFLKALESSGADEQLLEIFNLNWNLLPAIDKAEQLFLAHFGSGVLAQKVPGTKVALMSDSHWNIIIGEDGKVVMNKEVKRDPNYFADHKTRKLLHNTTDPITGQVYSECVLSERVFTKFGLSIGDEIPTDVATMLGYRIPTQDKHSMISLRVVDVLPNHLEGTGIFPSEIVLLSGADFDIDSLFIQQPAFWIKDKKAIKSGTEKTVEDKWNGFLAYIKKDKLFQVQYEDGLKNNFDYTELKKIKKKDRTEADNLIIKNEENNVFITTLLHFGLPTNEQEYSQTSNLNNEALNNEILDSKLSLLTNEAMRDIALTPVSSDPLIDEANYIQELKGETAKTSYSASSLLGKSKAFFQNSAGKAGIGPVANALQAFTFLAKNKLMRVGESKLNIDGQELEAFKYLTGDQRIADTLSTVLSVMTDNAKDPLAGKIGLSLEILTPYNYLISLGVPLRTITKIINTPIIQMYAAYLKENNYKLKSSSESKGTRNEKITNFFESKLGITNPDIEGLKEQYKDSEIDTSGLESVIKDGVINEQNRDINTLMLIKFLQIEEEAKNFQDLNNLIKLTKGLPTSFTDVDKGFKESLYNLGLEDLFELPVRETKKIPTIYVEEVVKKDELLFNNIKKALQIQKHAEGIFITETKQFKNAFETLVLNLKDSISKDDTKELKRNLLGFITTKAYIDWMKSKPSNPIPGFRPGNDSLLFPDLGGNTLAKQLVALQNSPDKNISKNAFITWLKPELQYNEKDEQTDKKLVFDKVSGKSFIKLSVESINDIVGSFQDLFKNEETKSFAIDAFNYLISKDNLEYKNDSFVKYIAPFMFNNVSIGLDNKLQGLVDYTSSLNRESEEFRQILASYIPTQKKFVKTVKLENLPTDTSTITFLPATAKKVFQSKIKMNESGSLILPYTIYKFPEFIRIKIGNDYKLYFSDLKGSTENWGQSAVYVEKPSFGYASVSPFSKTYKDNLETYERLKEIKAAKVPNIPLTIEGQSQEQAESIDFDNLDKERTAQAPVETNAIPLSGLLGSGETNIAEKFDNSEKKTILPEGLTNEDLDNIPNCP